MRVQVEITTRCNFNCFYCVGRDMEQVDMDVALFNEVLNTFTRRYGPPDLVSLQGEGEPTLHPEFLKLAETVRECGAEPYTITNGTYSTPEKLFDCFNRIGVSIDTLDPLRADKIGRFNLHKVLDFVEAIHGLVEVDIYSVEVAVDLDQVAGYCEEQGLTHIVQPLQTKFDYHYRYPGMVSHYQRPSPFSCVYLQEDVMRYYDVRGVEMPCCFIKEQEEYPGIERMREMAAMGHVPPVCNGCHFGMGSGYIVNSSLKSIK